MSTLFVEIVEISEVIPHPNADRLEIAKVLGTQVVVAKDQFVGGQKAVYFPPDMLIANQIANDLGVAKYLKHAIFPGDLHRTQCRVAGCRLRGVPSFGFLIPNDDFALTPVGVNVSDYYNAVKYEPPVRLFRGGGDRMPDHPSFHKYTSIEHFWRNRTAIPEGMDVVITEKIHGTNARFGSIGRIAMVGSHNVRLKESEKCLWWKMLSPNIVELLRSFDRNVILFGEIYGEGIQDMDYGAGGHKFRAFDLSIDGEYIDFWKMVEITQGFGIESVPALYRGPFSRDILEELTDGYTSIETPSHIKSKFKGREGVVVRPTTEQFSDVLGGRLILKSVSADYLDRKGAQDN